MLLTHARIVMVLVLLVCMQEQITAVLAQMEDTLLLFQVLMVDVILVCPRVLIVSGLEQMTVAAV
jgi:hypothetical protein